MGTAPNPAVTCNSVGHGLVRGSAYRIHIIIITIIDTFRFADPPPAGTLV